MKINIISWLLFIPKIGFSRLWYQAALARHCAQATQLEPVQFQNDQTGGGLFKLLLGNLLILIVTVGLGIPIIHHRNMKFISKHVSIIGDLTNLQFMQAPGQLQKSGEGIETVFGEDSGIF